MKPTSLPWAGATPILVVAPAGRLRASLAAVLKPLAPVQLVDPVEKESVTIVQVLLEAGPWLVLIDAALPAEQSWQWLGWIKQGWPHVQCLLLVEDLRQEQQAQQRGADHVLRKGFSLTELLATITAATQAEEQTLPCSCQSGKEAANGMI